MLGLISVSLYMKNNVFSVMYMYDVLVLQVSVVSFFVQVNSEGVKGYCGKGELVFGIDVVWIYVKDQMQLLMFMYQLVVMQVSSVVFVQQLNMFGVQGIVYFGDFVFGMVVLYYFQFMNCVGFLCMVFNLLIQN